jgi:hypothetical protein
VDKSGKAGRPVVVDPKGISIGEGDTEEDEGLADLDNVALKQRATIRKGKQRDPIQQTDRETHLQILLVWQRQLTDFFSPASVHLQPSCDDDQSLCDLDPNLLDDFNVGDIENADDWIGDKHLLEISGKNPSKLTEALALEVKSSL